MTEEQIARIKEWVEKNPVWLSETTEYSRGYKAGIMQARYILKSILNDNNHDRHGNEPNTLDEII